MLPGSRPGPKPGFIEPCQPTLRDVAPSGDRWVHEIKFDGYRVQAHLEGLKPVLFTRNGYDWTARFASIAAAVKRLPVNTIVLDGEVIVQDRDGHSSMDALVADLESGRHDRFVYYAFDLLHLDGFTITASPLVERKRVLASLLKEAGSSSIAYSEHLELPGPQMFEHARQMGLEGIVSKTRDAPYRSGRATTWIKTKVTSTDRFAIIGLRTNGRKLVSLHVARRSGRRLIYAGRVGTGFTANVAAELIKLLTSLVVDKPATEVTDAVADDRWVQPVLDAEIDYRGLSEGRLLRHAVFKKLIKPLTTSLDQPGRRRRRARRKGPLLVIDGDSFAHRAYHAVPKSIRRANGRGGNAIVGFSNYLVRLHQSERPRTVLVAWDTLSAPNWRSKLFPPYQSGRKFDKDLLEQLDILPSFVAACGFLNAKQAGYEADDFFAAAKIREEKRGGIVVVASGDRDAFQLASKATSILYPVRAGEMARIGVAEVQERYGVDPEQVPDFIALRGDPSDKIPGAKGIGPQGAANLLRRYPTLENALADGKLSSQAKALRLYRRIATMDAKAPIPRLIDTAPDWQGGSALADEWGLDALARRLRELSKAPA